MTSPDDVIFLKFSEIYGQYFPLSNFKKKDTLVFSSLSSIRLGLSPKGLVKRKRPNVNLRSWKIKLITEVVKVVLTRCNLKELENQADY